MKPFHLNLASHPYRDYRPVYAVLFATAVVTAILMIYNVETAYRYLVNTRNTRAAISRSQAEAARERAASKAISDQLARIDASALNSEIDFINEQIADRAFSWSRLLDALEKVTPQDVRITRLNPSTDKTGRTNLQVTCSSHKWDGMVRFLDRLNADPHFSNPFPQGENESNGDFSFSVTVAYRDVEGGVRR